MPGFYPQPYPLWAYRDGEIGRVIGWEEEGESGPAPVVWDVDYGARQWNAHGPEQAVFLFDTEEKAMEEVAANLKETLQAAAERHTGKD